jgi:hypothetical protein
MISLSPRRLPLSIKQKFLIQFGLQANPALTVNGEHLKFIVDTDVDPNSLQHDHFKELGRWISVDLRETKMKTEIRRRLFADLETVECVNGLCKLFIYEATRMRL